MDRRQFVTWSAGGALLLGVPGAARSSGTGVLSEWIRLEPDGRAVLISTVSDMGQGSRTGQVQILADELDIAWDAITVEMAPDREPFLVHGELYTGGSRAIRDRWDRLRAAGATVRAQLVMAAAGRWGVAAETCQAELGVVRHPASGRSLGYGELASDAAGITPPSNPPLKAASARRYIGKPIAVLGMRDRVEGKATYGIDLRLPGMLRASIRQAPVFGATLVSVDEAPALATPGVRKVVKLPSAVAVVADNTWAAFQGVRALDPQWSLPRSRPNSAAIRDRLKAGFDAPSATVLPSDDGRKIRDQLRTGYAAAARKIEATYEAPYLSHAPLEPMNATAQVSAGKVEIWAPNQAQSAVVRDVAKALGRPVSQIVLHTSLIGGGFGRRLRTDYAVLAALVARETDAPVQLVWTREEDMTHDFYRPTGILTYRAALGPDGLPTGLEMVGATSDDTAFGSSGPRPYAIAPFAATQTSVEAGIPVGAWRSVDASITVFAKESFLDECAHAVGDDPLAYRRRLLGSNVRARRVLDAAAAAIGWGSAAPPGVGRGLALLDSWDTVTAHAVEVRVEGGSLKVLRMVVAADPGTVVNPQQARAQFEGGALMGLGAALGEQVTISDGRVDQTNFDGYRVLNMRQAPPVEVLLFETPDATIGGVGEPPVPGAAPALANAIFAATGQRIRTLPVSAAGMKI